MGGGGNLRSDRAVPRIRRGSPAPSYSSEAERPRKVLQATPSTRLNLKHKPERVESSLFSEWRFLSPCSFLLRPTRHGPRGCLAGSRRPAGTPAAPGHGLLPSSSHRFPALLPSSSHRFPTFPRVLPSLPPLLPGSPIPFALFSPSPSSPLLRPSLPRRPEGGAHLEHVPRWSARRWPCRPRRGAPGTSARSPWGPGSLPRPRRGGRGQPLVRVRSRQWRPCRRAPDSETLPRPRPRPALASKGLDGRGPSAQEGLRGWGAARGRGRGRERGRERGRGWPGPGVGGRTYAGVVVGGCRASGG